MLPTLTELLIATGSTKLMNRVLNILCKDPEHVIHEDEGGDFFGLLSTAGNNVDYEAIAAFEAARVLRFIKNNTPDTASDSETLINLIITINTDLDKVSVIIDITAADNSQTSQEISI